MATQRLTISGYGQIELNRVSFPITGKVIADLPLDASFDGTPYAENGMVLAVNYATGKVTLPTGTDAILGLHYSPEREYDPQITGLKNFKLAAGNFYPRLGLPNVGDRFTTNCLQYDTTDFAATDAAAKVLIAAAGTTAVYGVPSVTGAIELVKAVTTEKLVFQVIGNTTMPDGTYGVKFVTITAQ